MTFLERRWPVLCYSVIALTCAAIVAMKLVQPEPASLSEFESDLKIIQDTINRNYVGNDYDYGKKASERLPQAPRDRDVWAFAPAHITYPRPLRPTVDPASVVKGPARLELTGELPTISHLRTQAQRGCIRIEFQLPETKNMKVTRVDVYRGEGAATLDSKLPLASVDLNTAKSADGWFSYADTHIEPKCNYSYRLQLIAMLHGDRVERDDSGKVVREVHYSPPAHATPQQDIREQRDFVSEPSPLISAVSPTNFELRFSGTVGRIPLSGAPDALAQDYKGRFLVRIWINEIQEWKEATLEVRPGERLAGKLLYKTAKNADVKAYKFDTGKVLEEIRRDGVSHQAIRREMVRDESDAPLVDEHNQPRTIEKKVITTAIPVDVAVLKDMETGKSEELKK